MRGSPQREQRGTAGKLEGFSQAGCPPILLGKCSGAKRRGLFRGSANPTSTLVPDILGLDRGY